MSSDGPIHVITLADDRYALPLAVTVRSLLDRLETACGLQITIIDGGFTGSARQKLIRSWSSAAAWPRCAIEWRAPDYGLAASLQARGRVPKLTYARINLAAYLPEVSRVILLDSDMLIRTCIGRLWDMPLGDAVAAAVPDPVISAIYSPEGRAAYAVAGLPPDAPYLNAGMMLVNLDLWRELGVGQRALEFAERNWRASRWDDQDAINAVLAGQWKPLDERWQVQPRLARLRSSADAGINDACVVHFSGRLKPWMYGGDSAADREFFEVLDRTEWRGWRPPVTPGGILTGFYANRLRRSLYPVEVRVLDLLSRVRRSRKAGNEA